MKTFPANVIINKLRPEDRSDDCIDVSIVEEKSGEEIICLHFTNEQLRCLGDVLNLVSEQESGACITVGAQAAKYD